MTKGIFRHGRALRLVVLSCIVMVLASCEFIPEEKMPNNSLEVTGPMEPDKSDGNTGRPDSSSADPETKPGRPDAESGGNDHEDGSSIVDDIVRNITLSEEPSFIEAGKDYRVHIPAGKTAFAIMMNFKPDCENDLSLTNAHMSIYAPTSKNVHITGMMEKPYVNEKGRVVWNTMLRHDGSKCKAIECARDPNNRIIYMYDRSMSQAVADNFTKALLSLYNDHPHAFPVDTIAEVNKQAGVAPTNLFNDRGKDWLFVLIEDFGNNLTLNGVCTVYPQLYGTHPSISVSARSFNTTMSSAYSLSSTIAHEYSHLLDIEQNMAKVGEPYFGCHLLTEGYADWSAVEATRHTFAEEAGYIGFWFENGSKWHPFGSWKNKNGQPISLADYGLGSMIWARLDYKYGRETLQRVFNDQKENFLTFEKETGVQFDEWMKDMIMEVLAVIGVDTRPEGSTKYLEEFRLSDIWCSFTESLPSVYYDFDEMMTSTGFHVVKLDSNTETVSFDGAEECILFALDDPEY